MTVQERMFKLETDLLANTIKHLSKGNFASAEWGAKRLAMLGVVNQSNLDLILKAEGDITPLLNAELTKAQKATATGVNNLVSADLLSKSLPLSANPRMTEILGVYERRAMGDISKTTPTMIRSLSQEYTSAIARATEQQILDIQAGKLLSGESIQTSIAKTAKTFSRQGITSLIDVSGKHWGIEGYSSLVVRSNTRQVSTQTQLEKFNEYDIDLVEISSHLGARPLCEPYQGRIYSRSGDSKVFPPLSSTSMGEIAGLFGINCGHRMYPYVEGTKRTNNPYPKKLNDKAYELSQEQRGLERGVRTSKRNIQLLNNAPDSLEKSKELRLNKSNLKIQRSELKKFTRDTGRTLIADRLRIY